MTGHDSMDIASCSVLLSLFHYFESRVLLSVGVCFQVINEQLAMLARQAVQECKAERRAQEDAEKRALLVRISDEIAKSVMEELVAQQCEELATHAYR